VKKLCFKIEENLGNEFKVSLQAEMWIWIPLVPGSWSSDKPVGFFLSMF